MTKQPVSRRRAAMLLWALRAERRERRSENAWGQRALHAAFRRIEKLEQWEPKVECSNEDGAIQCNVRVSKTTVRHARNPSALLNSIGEQVAGKLYDWLRRGGR